MAINLRKPQPTPTEDFLSFIREKQGKAIQLRRKELGLTQEQLANQAGLNKTTISLIETGKNWPGGRETTLIRHVLGLPLI